MPLNALTGARIWFSASVPETANKDERNAILEFVARLSTGIFRAGGSVIHGSHPTIWPVLLEQAAVFQRDNDGTRDCLTLAVSRHYSKQPERFGIPKEEWLKHSIVHEVPEIPGSNARDSSLEALRHWMADRSDAIVIVGGRSWGPDPAAAGVPLEFEMARNRGLPCFFLGGLGGASEQYLEMYPEMLRNLKNGFTRETNLDLARERKIADLVSTVLAQLERLPLVRGPNVSGSVFRILALDGGGIKGAFTAAALAKWEELTGRKITDHFDLIAGTSTGGILAIGLGMGLRPAAMLDFYKSRGPKIFPLTSIGMKARYFLKHLILPKFSQKTLLKELRKAYYNEDPKRPAPNRRRTMKQSSNRLVIPACHARSGRVIVFRTNHHPDVIKDANREAALVALATAAAPTYFPAAVVDESAHVDGGLWANNPALVALVEAVTYLGTPLNHIDILSVGTTSTPYSRRKQLKAGFFRWGIKLLTLMMHAQGGGVENLTQNLSGNARFLRVDQTLVPREVSLDDVTRIQDLVDYGKTVAEQPEVLAQVRSRFLNGVSVSPWTSFT